MGLCGKEGAKRRCRCFAEEGVRKELLISQSAGTGSLLPRLQLTLSARRCRAGKGVLGVAALMRERERERKKGQKQAFWPMKRGAVQAWVPSQELSLLGAAAWPPRDPRGRGLGGAGLGAGARLRDGLWGTGATSWAGLGGTGVACGDMREGLGAAGGRRAETGGMLG